MGLRLATRYAKSLVQLAEEKDQLDAVFSDVKRIDRVFETNRDLKLMFKSPIITADKKLSVVQKLFENKIHDLLYRFLVLMIKKGREANFHETVESFVIQYNTLRQITPVTITSAVKLDEGLVQSILANLKKKESLKELELYEVIKPEIIGGFILQYGDKMIDNSVIRSLNTLKNIVEDDSYIKKYS